MQLKRLGEIFNINPLVQEDILNTNSRPKLDEYEEYIYIVVKTLAFEKESNLLHGEQISIILGKDFVMSFSESECKVFDPVIKRIKGAKSLTRKMGVDYLAYTADRHHSGQLLRGSGEYRRQCG